MRVPRSLAKQSRIKSDKGQKTLKVSCSLLDYDTIFLTMISQTTFSTALYTVDKFHETNVVEKSAPPSPSTSLANL